MSYLWNAQFIRSKKFKLLSYRASGGLLVNSLIKEYQLKGKAQYSWPPCTNWFRSAAFDNANIIYFLTKTRYLDEEVKRTEPSLKLGFPAPA